MLTRSVPARPCQDIDERQAPQETLRAPQNEARAVRPPTKNNQRPAQPRYGAEAAACSDRIRQGRFEAAGGECRLLLWVIKMRAFRAHSVKPIRAARIADPAGQSKPCLRIHYHAGTPLGPGSFPASSDSLAYRRPCAVSR